MIVTDNVYTCTCIICNCCCILQFSESQFVLRNITSHLVHCTEIEGDEGGTKSIEAGVNSRYTHSLFIHAWRKLFWLCYYYRSTLMDLSYFNVCSGALLPDVMHDMLEGALQYELKLLLKYCLSCGFFRLSTMNEMIEGMEYGYMETNKPTPITTQSLSATDSNLLKQNGN